LAERYQRDRLAGRTGRPRAILERRSRLKFKLPRNDVSGAWLGMRVAKLHMREDRTHEAELADGERLGGALFASTIPTEVYLKLVPGDATPNLAFIRCSALISVICATRRAERPGAYRTNLASLARTAAGIFLLSALNPRIGRPGDGCVNFVPHLRGGDRPLFASSDEGLVVASGAFRLSSMPRA